MDKNFLKKIKGQLLQEKRRVENELEQFAKKSKKTKNDYQAQFLELGSKEEENAQEVTLYESRLCLERDLENILRDINKALDKIKKGTYGTCDNCGQEIPKPRLEAFPSAVLCLKCKKAKA